MSKFLYANIAVSFLIAQASVVASADCSQKPKYVRKGQVLSCPVTLLVADKDTGFKEDSDAGIGAAHYVKDSHLQFDECGMAKTTYKFDDRYSVEIKGQADAAVDIIGLAYYIVDGQAGPKDFPVSSYLPLLTKFDKVSTGGGWDGAANTKKYVFIDSGVEPNSGYARLGKIQQRLIAAGLLDHYSEKMDTNELMQLKEIMKTAVAKGFVTDGELVGLGTAFFCSLQ